MVQGFNYASLYLNNSLHPFIENNYRRYSSEKNISGRKTCKSCYKMDPSSVSLYYRIDVAGRVTTRACVSAVSTPMIQILLSPIMQQPLQSMRRRMSLGK